METLLTVQNVISVGSLISILGGVWWAGRTFGEINEQIKANSENIEHVDKDIEERMAQHQKVCDEKIGAIKAEVTVLKEKSDMTADRLARVETNVANIDKKTDFIVEHITKLVK